MRVSIHGRFNLWYTAKKPSKGILIISAIEVFFTSFGGQRVSTGGATFLIKRRCFISSYA